MIDLCLAEKRAKSISIRNMLSTIHQSSYNAATMSYSKESITRTEDMATLRTTIDALDADLISLLELRFQCMDAAARIKGEREAVRDETRKAEVLENVKKLAGEAGIPAPSVAAMWEILIETSISYELQKWDTLRD